MVATASKETATGRKATKKAITMATESESESMSMAMVTTSIIWEGMEALEAMAAVAMAAMVAAMATKSVVLTLVPDPHPATGPTLVGTGMEEFGLVAPTSVVW